MNTSDHSSVNLNLFYEKIQTPTMIQKNPKRETKYVNWKNQNSVHEFQKVLSQSVNNFHVSAIEHIKMPPNEKIE